MLSSLAREQEGAHRRQCLDDPAVDAAVDDAVALKVLRADGELRTDLILRRVRDGHAHGADPTLRYGVELRGEILDHEMKSYWGCLRRPSRGEPPSGAFGATSPRGGEVKKTKLRVG